LSYTITDLTPDAFASVATAINNAGEAVGYFNAEPGMDGHAFQSDGSTLEDLGTLVSGGSSANAINDLGNVASEFNAGQGFLHAFLTTGSGGIDPDTDDLGTLGGVSSRAFAVNNLGQVAGSSADSAVGHQHAFLYADGTMSDRDLGRSQRPALLGY